MKCMKTVRAWATLNYLGEIVVPFEGSLRGGDPDLMAVFRSRKRADGDCCGDDANGMGDRVVQIEIREVTPATRKRASKRAKGRR